MEKFLPVLLLASVVILSGCISTPGQNGANQSIKTNADCSPFNPLDDPCEMLAHGAYVSSVTGECEYNDGNACSQMPFETLKDCQSSCEESDPETLCNGVVCGEGKACFEGGCIPTS